jgi:hypothetical protein
MMKPEDIQPLLSKVINLDGCVIREEDAARLAGRVGFAAYVITNLNDNPHMDKQNFLNKAIRITLNSLRSQLQSNIKHMMKFDYSGGKRHVEILL